MKDKGMEKLSSVVSCIRANHRAIDERYGVGKTESKVYLVISVLIVAAVYCWAFWYSVRLVEDMYDIDFWTLKHPDGSDFRIFETKNKK